MTMRRFALLFRGLMVMLCLLPLTGRAEFNGEIRARAGTHLYNVNIGNMNLTSNVPGAEYVFEFSIPDIYVSEVYCTRVLSASSVLYTGQATILQPGSSPSFLKLNDYMDVKIEVYIGGKGGEGGGPVGYKTIPFNDVDNGSRLNGCNPQGPTNVSGWEIMPISFSSGGKGRVTFKLTRPIINGISLQGTQVARLYGRLSEGDPGLGNPLSLVNINSGIVSVADKCVFNNGNPINVDFKTIPGTGSKLNGINYSQPVPIHVKCQGGSFATGETSIRLSIRQPNPAVFNSDYLGTIGAGSNLGIALRDSGGNTVVPNKFYPAKGFSNNEGDWNLTAAPIANKGIDIPEGEFTASATVVADFP